MPKQTYNQASQRAVNRSQVEGMNLGTDASEFHFEDELTAIEAIAGRFVERVKENINTAGIKASGKMGNLTIQPIAGGVQIVGSPHLIYQDLGVNGSEVKLYDTPFSYKDKMPPIEDIKAWIKEKGLTTRDNRKFGGKTVDIDEGAAFAIAKKIQKEGVAPKNIYSKEIPQLVEELKAAMVNVAITGIFKNKAE